MKKSSKVAVVAGLGAIAGGVAGYYLNSDKGRQQRKVAGETIKEQSTKAVNYAADMATKAKAVASDITEKAQTAFATATNKAEQVRETVADGVDQLKLKTEKIVTNGRTNVVG